MNVLEMNLERVASRGDVAIAFIPGQVSDL